MDLEKYKKYLSENNAPADEIEEKISIIDKFTQFLSTNDPQQPSVHDEKQLVEDFSEILVSEGLNTYDNYSTLWHYCGWLGRNGLLSAFVEAVECDNALETLAEIIETNHNRNLRNRIFSEGIPPSGSSEKNRYAFTRKILENMERYLTQQESRQAWFSVQHGIPRKLWNRHDSGEKKVFKQFGNIDEYLEFNWKKQLDHLTSLRNEGKLWYTQELNDDVLDLVKANQEIEAGKRVGDKIYITKIPYQAIRYFHENEPRMKQYRLS